MRPDRQQARPTLDGLPTLKTELQTKAGSHLSQSPKCLREPSCLEACPMASNCHLLQRATFVEIAASTEPGNLALQLALVLDPESGCLATCPRHRSSLVPPSWRLSLVWRDEAQNREQKGLFCLPAAPSLPQSSVPPSQAVPSLLCLQIRSQPGDRHTPGKPLTFRRAEQPSLAGS